MTISMIKTNRQVRKEKNSYIWCRNLQVPTLSLKNLEKLYKWGETYLTCVLNRLHSNFESSCDFSYTQHEEKQASFSCIATPKNRCSCASSFPSANIFSRIELTNSLIINKFHVTLN